MRRRPRAAAATPPTRPARLARAASRRRSSHQASRLVLGALRRSLAPLAAARRWPVARGHERGSASRCRSAKRARNASRSAR
jgi:hypothetical protein